MARYRHNMSPVPAGSNVMTYFRRSDTSEWVNVSPKYNHQGSVQVLSETDGSESALATYVYEDQFGVTDLTSATAATSQRLQFGIGVRRSLVASLGLSNGLYLDMNGFWLPGPAAAGRGAGIIADEENSFWSRFKRWLSEGAANRAKDLLPLPGPLHVPAKQPAPLPVPAKQPSPWSRPWPAKTGNPGDLRSPFDETLPTPPPTSPPPPPPPAPATVKSCGPDVTQWLYDQMRRNRRPRASSAFPLSPQGLADLGVDPRVASYVNFAFWVQPGGLWDFKASQKFVTGGCPVRPGGCNFTVTIAGECFNYDVPGNIHYGYIGKGWGFPIASLAWGAVGASIFTIGGSEPLDDWNAVKLGMDLHDSNATFSEFIDAVKRNSGTLNKRNTRNCTPCTEAYGLDGDLGRNPALDGTDGFGRQGSGSVSPNDAEVLRGLQQDLPPDSPSGP